MVKSIESMTPFRASVEQDAPLRGLINRDIVKVLLVHLVTG